MQSCAWTTSNVPSRSSGRRPSRYVAIVEAIFASKSPSGGVCGTTVAGTAGARKNAAPGGPTANSSTAWPRAASASATAIACTTPPRGRTEYVSIATRSVMRP